MANQTKLPKAKLIETAAQIVYKQGWNATGINQILGDAKVPKGSFYYYFHSKEELGIAIINFRAQQFQERYERTFLNEKLAGRAAVEAYFAEFLPMFREMGWAGGCPVGTFSNEIADTTERIAEACRACLAAFVAAATQAFIRGQADGTITRAESPEKLAVQFSELWQGALLHMKLAKSERPLLDAIDLVRRAFFSAH